MSYLNLADTELYYQEGGQPEGESVVFVNGLTMDTTAWAGVETRFADRYRTVRYDCRGQGQSGKPEGPYLPTQHAADLKVLLDALALEHVHLVGLSNGGLVSALVAGELQERILSLSLIDSFIRIDSMLKLILTSWKAALAAGGSALRFDVAAPWIWGSSFIEKHADLIEEAHKKASQADPKVVGWLIDGLLGFDDAHKALRLYEGPVLAAVGQEDLLTPLRYSHEIVEWAKRGILVTIDHAGHAAPIERPEAVARVVRGFIERREEFVTPLWQ